MFENRTDAGEQLADVLDAHDVAVDVVLAIPRGGLPVGRVVADALDVPLDVVAARKIGAPHNPELAIGSVASDGTVWLNEALIDDLGVDEAYLEAQSEVEREAAEEKVSRYRADREPLELADERVLIVDDGVATGATTTACIREVKNRGAAWVGLAVPVGPPDTIERLGTEADEVFSVETPPHFGAVGQFYRNFSQVSDEEAMGYLA